MTHQTVTTGLSADRADAIAALLKCLANPLRLRLLSALRAGPLAVGDLQNAVGATQSTVSLQLMRMRTDGLVSCHRSDADARVMLYAICDPRIPRVLDLAEAF